VPEQVPSQGLADLLTTQWVVEVEENLDGHMFSEVTPKGEGGFLGPLVYLYYRPYRPEWLDGLRERDEAVPPPPPFSIKFGLTSITLCGQEHELVDPEVVRAYKTIYEARGEWVSGRSLEMNLSQLFHRHLPPELRNYIESRPKRGFRWIGPIESN
jgi:hypothetical protein